MLKNRFFRRVALLIGMLMVLSTLVSLQAVYANYLAQATLQQAIKIASAHPPVAKALQNTPGWKARGYNTRNLFGAWRVEFFSEQEDTFAYVHLNPEKGKVYWSEVYGYEVPLSDEQEKSARTALLNFINKSEETVDFRTLLKDNIADGWISYDAPSDTWGYYVWTGTESVGVLIKFAANFTNPVYQGMYFDLLEVGVWEDSKKAEAALIAFKSPEVTKALSGVSGWTSLTEIDNEGVFIVTFKSGEKVLARAKVDVIAGKTTVICTENCV
jgi:hypothetical protein